MALTSDFEMDQENQENTRSFLTMDSIRFTLNYLARFSIAGVVIFASTIAIQNYSWFTWHVILCTVGYVPLMAESLMLFLGDEVWSKNMTRSAKYTIHGIVISIATILIIIGDGLVFYNLDALYLRTTHSITGLISLIFLVISLPFGLMIKYNREVAPYLPIRTIWAKTLHNFLGILGYGIGVISLCYGFYTNWFSYYTSYEARLLALIATLLTGLWTLNGAIISLVEQINTILS
ncbi:hypothetical protein ABEB36_002346 [Hypothenemus hampei]|uniref:ascorbate ferrireductase (transmembrane) n=1 Tax=Hypothenemus hampei TaxID=57062 RepID=A0ABD1F737_HYPHA